MKQRITVDQLQELTEEQQQRLREWWKPTAWDVIVVYHGMGIKVTNVYNEMVSTDKKACLPLLSIGQMIELIEDKRGINYIKYIKPIFCRDVILKLEGWDIACVNDYYGKGKELADALWSAVKEVL